MRKIAMISLLVVVAISASGCSTIKRMTGQRDDSVLPGQREEILPPDQQVSQDPKVTGKKQAACDPKTSVCAEPVDQESTTPQ